MSQKLFELIKGMTGHKCQEDELNEIIRVVKKMDAPDVWIPVSEKLPEHEKNVLAVLDGQVRIMCYLTIRDSGKYFKAWAMVYDTLGGDAHFDDEYEPTHWMAIPKPPKKNLTIK
jgi:hypothetical protein